MTRPRVRLVRQIGAGEEGTAWAARDAATGALYTLHRLTGLASDLARLRALAARVRLMGLLPDVGALRVREADLDGAEPWLLVERVERCVGDVLLDGPMPTQRVLSLFERLAHLLAEAHRLGLHHGALRAGSVVLDDADEPAACLLGVATGAVAPSPFDARARPDEEGAPADVAALADLVESAWTGRPPDPGAPFSVPVDDDAATLVGEEPIAALLSEMRREEPEARPSAQEVRRRLAQILQRVDPHADAPITTASDAPPEAPIERLGRFRLLEVLGEGAMGRVHLAEDMSDGQLVAVKVLARDALRSPRALVRFKKEARILGEVKNPCIANLVEVNEDAGRIYIAVELVRGKTLSSVLAERGPFAERDALAIAADVARALADVHARGIVHRDVKPDNVLLVDAPGSSLSPGAGARAKLVDFGVARHVDESESLAMTRDGAVIGTPLYMSPEQCRGQPVDARSDVYSLGTTLYELLVGRAPFAGKGVAAVMVMQAGEVPPRVDELKPEVSEAVASLVERMLDKEPARRPADGAAVLGEIELLLEVDRMRIAAHPIVARDPGVKTWSFRWDLASSPAELWPYVSNTERLNRAVGFSAVEEMLRVVDEEVQRFGRARAAGLELLWREQPFEWIEGKRLGVLREYSEGPLRWLKSTVDLVANDAGGTRLVHTIEVDPRGVVGRAAAAVEIGVKSRRALERVYLRIDDLLARARKGGADPLDDAFEERFSLPRDREQRLAELERAAIEQGAPPLAVARLGDFVRAAPPQDVARMRPIALARRFGVREPDMVRASFVAAHVGMLSPLWDLLCPACRAPAAFEETLRAVKEHARCEVCNIDFALDLASSIELVFRPHPSLREADAQTYCLSSPAHTPHVAAQIRLAPGEDFRLDLQLQEGAYQLVGRKLSFRLPFVVRARAPTSRWELSLKSGAPPELPRALALGEQVVVLHNDTGREQLVRIERAVARDDALTAARAVAHPPFRRLFPTEVLQDGSLLQVSSVSLLGVDLVGETALDAAWGDGRAFATLYAMFKAMEERVALSGGAVVKLQGDGVLAAFDDPASAVRAALALEDVVAGSSGAGLEVRAAVHRGPVAAVTLNDRLDYFGRTVRELQALLHGGEGGDVVVGESAAADPVVARLLQGRAREGGVLDVGGAPAQRFRLRA